MLEFDTRWRFESPGQFPSNAADDIFEQVLCRVVSHGERQDILEVCKRRFAHAAGMTASRSSSESWALSDLRSYMEHASENAALFVEALYDGLVDATRLRAPATIPPWSYVNRYLAPTGYRIEVDSVPPALRIGSIATPIAVPSHVPSLDAQANQRIRESLAKSETFLNTGEYRAAVQEILWLLETVSTVFHGVEYPDGSVTGKYFSKIIGDLQRIHNTRSIGRVLGWMENVYGFLSSPSGGGIRHGAVLNATLDLSEGDARLYCDLTRSYISYLLHEHSRL